MDNYTIQNIKYNLRFIRQYVPNISYYYKQIKIGRGKKVRNFNKNLFVEICKLPEMNRECSYYLSRVFCDKTEKNYKSHYDNDFNIIDVHINYLIRYAQNNPNAKISFDKIIKESAKKYWDDFLPSFHRRANTILSFLN